MAKRILALDYGDKKIGVALADDSLKIPIPQGVIYNDDQMMDNLLQLIESERIDQVVVGYPRNQSGQPTAQTAKVELFADNLKQRFKAIIFQDESLTSVLAEERLKRYKKSYTKEDIDAQAAALILEDYLECR